MIQNIDDWMQETYNLLRFQKDCRAIDTRSSVSLGGGLLIQDLNKDNREETEEEE